MIDMLTANNGKNLFIEKMIKLESQLTEARQVLNVKCLFKTNLGSNFFLLV